MDVGVVELAAVVAVCSDVVDAVCRAAVAAARSRAVSSVKPYDTHVSLNFYIEYECVVSIECYIVFRRHHSIHWRIVHHRCCCSSDDPSDSQGNRGSHRLRWYHRRVAC